MAIQTTSKFDWNKIHVAREAKQWTLTELAKRSGLSVPTIWSYEHGKITHPKVETMQAICTALGIDAADITNAQPKGAAASLETITRLFNQLDSEGRRVVVDLAKSLLGKPRK